MYKIFISGMAYDHGKSGISTYINSVVEELVKFNKVELLLLNMDESIFPVKHPNLKIITIPNYLAKPLINLTWHLFILPIFWSFKKYDFIFLSAGQRRIFCRYPRFTIVAFHDLSQYHIPQKYDPIRMFYIKKVIPIFVKRANSIFAVSESTKKDLLKFYHLDEDKVFVNINSYDKKKYNMDYSASTVFPHNLKKKFFLYISRIEHPGKNHLRLIKAYEKLPESIKKEYDLVFAGSIWLGGQVVTDYTRKISDRERIHFLGFVKDETLIDLYHCSSLYIFPSLFEGFGTPLVEAMACGIPVICSNVSSLPEVGGDAVLTFDPEDVDDIHDCILKVMSDSNLRKEMIKKGLERAKEFDWAKHAGKIVRKFEEYKKTHISSV